MIFSLPDLSATERLAQSVACCVQVDDIIFLDGELGAGKTSFVRALVVALGGDGNAVSSPTYTLLHSYEADISVIHIDAYRLRDEADLEGLGFTELREGGIACIEWAQSIGCCQLTTEDHAWSILLEHTGDGGRKATMSVPDGRENITYSDK